MVHPEVVREIHKDYIEAGADIITTNTFRTTRRTLRRSNLPDRSLQITNIAVAIARQAREECTGREILIAGSVAPLEDCYRPDLVPPDRDLTAEHAELASRLADAGVDFILLETMNTIREAYAACAAAAATGKEVVVSFICNDKAVLLSGESVHEAVKAVSELSPSAFSINCVSPHHIIRAADELKRATLLPFALYGNVGLPESNKHGWEFTHDILEDEYARCTLEWRRQGASIIGGCCGTSPAYIRAVANSCKA
jgi:S-methylmethionine-dependent homocysteine/selenocysteine methylase